MDDNKEVTEVRETRSADGGTNVRQETVAKSDTVSSPVFARRLVYYIGGALLALLVVRFLLLLFGAAQGNPFVDFVYGLSEIFVWPFNGIFGEPSYGSVVFDSSTLVAIVVYGLLSVGIGRLFTLNRRDPDAEA